jgi:hypothetical protein
MALRPGDAEEAGTLSAPSLFTPGLFEGSSPVRGAVKVLLGRLTR